MVKMYILVKSKIQTYRFQIICRER